MADSERDPGPWELTGYEVGGEWRNIEAGDDPPSDSEWGEIELVTVNLDPESEEGMYRTYVVEGGFDDLYGVEDLVYEAMASYGLLAE